MRKRTTGDPPKMPFGKYKGQDIEDCPKYYLQWLLDQDWFEKSSPTLLPFIEEEVEFREINNLD